MDITSITKVLQVSLYLFKSYQSNIYHQNKYNYNKMQQTQSQKAKSKLNIPKNQQPQQNDHGDDDCEDCKREKQQNKILINMYEKLKNIQSKVGKIKGDLTNHQKQTQLNYHTIIKIHKNFEHIKSIKNTLTGSGNQNLIGIQVASNVIQKAIRTKLQQQNKKLKADFIKVKQQNQLLKKANTTSISRASEKLNQNGIRQIQNLKIPTTSSSIDNYQSTIQPIQLDIPKQINSQQKHRKVRQSQVQKKSVLDSQFWLFSNEQNMRLENELYKNMKNKRYFGQDTSTKNESNFNQFSQKGKQQQFELPFIKKARNLRQNNDLKLLQSINKVRLNNKLPSLSLNKKK